MKPNDLLVAFVLSAAHPAALPPFKDLAQASGLSISQCFDAVESLYEARLIKPSRKAVDLPAFESFLLHALPFVMPARILGPGKGTALSLWDTSAVSGPSGSRSAAWVWPEERGTAQGVQLAPMHAQLSRLLAARPEWLDVVSCIEILRFHEHPLRSKAAERVHHWCRSQAALADPPAAAPAPASPSRLLDDAAAIVAETGYRHASLAAIAGRLGRPVAELEARFGTPAGLAAEIGRSCAARANAHLGKIMLSRPENRVAEARESLDGFLEFLDHNEDYFRLGAWFYAERMFTVSEGAGLLTAAFFDRLEEIFEQIPSQRPARARAILFANAWVAYAWFRWVESPRLPDRAKAEADLRLLRATLVGLLT